jgi:L-lysine exporter family protein LysE/ArgO
MIGDFVAGLLAGAALIVAIGAQNAFVLRQGIRREHVLPIVLVCAGADALLIAAGVVGLGALIRSAPALLNVARYGGALFLLLYGTMAARRALHPHKMLVDPSVGSSLGAAMAACLAFTFLNPHVYLDTVILVGSLASQRKGAGRWAFGSGAAAASLAWFCGLSYGARLLAPLFTKPVAWRVLDSAIALIMWGLGIALLLKS